MSLKSYIIYFIDYECFKIICVPSRNSAVTRKLKKYNYNWPIHQFILGESFCLRWFHFDFFLIPVYIGLCLKKNTNFRFWLLYRIISIEVKLLINNIKNSVWRLPRYVVSFYKHWNLMHDIEIKDSVNQTWTPSL